MSGGPGSALREGEECGRKHSLDLGLKQSAALNRAVYGDNHKAWATVDTQQTHEFSSPPRGSPNFLSFSGRKLGFAASLFLTCADLP